MQFLFNSPGARTHYFSLIVLLRSNIPFFMFTSNRSALFLIAVILLACSLSY